MKTLFKLLTVFFLLAAPFLPAVAQTDGLPQVFLLDQPLFDPQDGSIRADLVVRDQHQSSPPDLIIANFSLDIGTRGMTLEPRSELPVAVSIVIDTSRGSAMDLIRDSVQSYFRYTFSPGDRVTLYIVEASNALTRRFREVSVTTVADAEAVLQTLSEGATFFDIRPALEAALSGLNSADFAEYEARHALFVGSFLNRPQDANLGSDFARAAVPLHVIHAHRHHDQSTGVFRQMASLSGGLFAANVDGSTLLAGSLQPINSLKTIYDSVASSRLVYGLRFKPDRVSAIQPQEAGLTITLPDDKQVQTRVQYNMNLLAPGIAFTSPDDLRFTLTPEISDVGTLTFDRASHSIGLAISFPDNVIRPIREVTVTVADATGALAPQTLRRLNPTIAEDGTLTVSWPLSPFQRLESTDITLTAEVTGEAGLSSTAIASGRISVAPLPTPVVSPSDQSQTSGRLGTANAAVVSGDQQMTIGLTDILLISNLVFVLAALLLLAFALRRRRAVVQTVPAQPTQSTRAPRISAPSLPAKPSGNGAETDLGLDQPTENEPDTFAQLIVIEGVDEIGQIQVPIQKKKFLIGRAPTCDLIIDQPFVSPEHCLVAWKDHRLYVRDLRSKNGTYVNGERIKQDMDADAPIGSEINVTKRIMMEIRRADYEYIPEDDAALGSTAHSTAMGDQLTFKRLPGLRYSSDDGPDISDEYSPL